MRGRVVGCVKRAGEGRRERNTRRIMAGWSKPFWLMKVELLEAMGVMVIHSDGCCPLAPPVPLTFWDRFFERIFGPEK